MRNEPCLLQEKCASTVSWNLLNEITGSQWHLYEDIEREMKCLDEDDTLITNINCCGGRIDMGQFLYNALKKCKAHKIMRVTAPSYSMAAVLALAGDDLVLEKHSWLMFHNYSGSSYGKGNEQERHVEAYGKYIRGFFADICTPFLTKKEMERVFAGEDLYIHWDDPSLQQRIARHFKKSKK